MKIKNVSELREFVAHQLERLCDNEIVPEQANACAMLSANMLLSVKLEMEYSKLIEQKPKIEFMENRCKTKLIEHNEVKSEIRNHRRISAIILQCIIGYYLAVVTCLTIFFITLAFD